MSKETRLRRVKAIYQQFLAQNPSELESFPDTFSDFDGPNLEETKKNLRFVLETFEGIQSADAWGDISWHTYNSLEGQLNNVNNFYTPFKAARDQGSFQNFAANLDSLAYHLRLFGLTYLAMGGAYIERAALQIASEQGMLTNTRTEVEKLRNELKALIEPAVAGSLSQAFTARKRTLFIGRLIWGLLATLIGIYCIYSTFGLASTLTTVLSVTKGTTLAGVVSKAPAVAVTPTALNEQLIWITIAIRTVILIPLYAAFGFSFSQYKKERDFEEEYAHKAAVATSLPNYGDLTREPAVRDQIVTGATNVIFLSPTSSGSRGSEKQENVLGGLKEVFDSVAKLVPKS